jgi:hypothetical protein
MPNVIMLSVIMLNVIILSVIIQSGITANFILLRGIVSSVVAAQSYLVDFLPFPGLRFH